MSQSLLSSSGGGRAENSGRPRQLEHPEQTCREEPQMCRRQKVPLEYAAECWSAHTCKEITEGWQRIILKQRLTDSSPWAKYGTLPLLLHLLYNPLQKFAGPLLKVSRKSTRNHVCSQQPWWKCNLWATEWNTQEGLASLVGNST